MNADVIEPPVSSPSLPDGVPDERSARILAAAVQLADEGGFSAVKLRDVAQTSGVALGTLYKRFRSKEDLMIAVVSVELAAFRARVAQTPIEGTRSERLLAVFMLLTDFLCERANLGRALIRSSAAGEPALSGRLKHFHGALNEVVGLAFVASEARQPTTQEITAVSILQRLWFSLMIGWSAGISTRDDIELELRKAIELLTYGLERSGSPPSSHH